MAELLRSELKLVARERMKGSWGFMLISWIIYAVIMGAVGWTGIGALLVTGPLTVGIYGVILSIVRGQEASYNNLFDGFKNFLPNFLAFLLMTIFTLLWSLLLIVPGIVAAIRYSQTFYILKDNPGLDGAQAIEASKKMMEGHKAEYFVLQLSFVLWYLLGVLSLGIAFIWIGPYVSTVNASYYAWLRDQSL